MHDEGNEENERTSKRRIQMSQIIAVCIKNTLLVTFGMTLGYPTILIAGLDEFDTDVGLISWISSVHLICIPVGCAISGLVTQIFGRKMMMLLVNIPFLGAWLFFGFATNTTQVIIALCITGLTGGLLEAPVLTYVAEICEPKLRGALSSTSTLSVVGGVLIEFLLGSVLSWKHVALANCFFPVLSFTLLFFVPESPYWLILRKRNEEAKKSIAWLRGWTNVKNIEQEYEELKQHIEKQDVNQSVNDKFKLFFKKNFLWPFSLVAFAFFLGHFSGMTTLQTYAVRIFVSVEAPISGYVATVILGVAQLSGCLFCVGVIHRLGKRIVSFISMIGCSLCFIVVATYVYLTDVTDLETLNTENVTDTTMRDDTNSDSWIASVFLILSAFLSHMGIRVLPWILTGELYSNETRAAGSGFSSAIGYIFSFAANKTFLYIVNGITLAGTFWLNAGIGLVGCALLYIFLPETEGKPLHEIQDHFRGGTKLGNLVKRKSLGLKPNGVDNKVFSMNEIDNPNAELKNHV